MSISDYHLNISAEEFDVDMHRESYALAVKKVVDAMQVRGSLGNLR